MLPQTVGWCPHLKSLTHARLPVPYNRIECLSGFSCEKEQLEYVTAGSEHIDGIRHVMQSTIRAVYPKYYPTEIVDFFCQLHSREHVQEGVESGNRDVLLDEGKIVGVGCADGNHITSVYVLPECQGQGFGSYILDCLEARIAREHETAVLDASLPAVMLYEHRGYKTTGHGVLDVGNDVKLVYEVMEKQLRT